MAVNQQAQVDREKLEAVRKRYAEEAAKRIRPEGLEQFLQLTETDEKRLHALVEDPWVDHDALNAQNSPIKNGEVYRFFVVGAGFGALQYAVRLIEEGVASASDIRLADAGGRVWGYVVLE